VENGDMEVVYDFISSALSASGVPPEYIAALEMVADEIVANIANYAYKPETAEKWAIVELCVNDSIEMTFIDHGAPFNPLSLPAPDVTLSAEERKIGGLGVYMVKSTMDGMSYSRKDGLNILTVTKNIK
jgi:anti-sigma regulatory factor (Ser/Thr protein kinase)